MNSMNKQEFESSRQERPPGWDSKHPRAIVYDPCSHELKTEDLTTLEGKILLSVAFVPCLELIAKYETFKVHLPWWRNKVDIYAYPETKSGFIATVQLDRLGRAKNWERRLRKNHRVMHVKGKKPVNGSRSASTSAASVLQSK